MFDSGDPLDKLQHEIDDVKAHTGIGTNGSENPDSGKSASAMLYATELFAGILVGGVAGYLLDGWLHTSPVLFIVLFFLGAAAGFRNIIRKAKNL